MKPACMRPCSALTEHRNVALDPSSHSKSSRNDLRMTSWRMKMIDAKEAFFDAW